MCDASKPETVLIAILVRDKAHTLPLFLKCIELQTWPKRQTGIYIRENDSSDGSSEILKSWADKHRNAPESERYREIYEDYSSVPGAADDPSHDWSASRFEKLAKIRRDSIDYADSNCYDAYFVVDADNFIRKEVLSNLMRLRHLGIVAPYLKLPGYLYSNYHFHVNEYGYYKGGSSQHLYDIVHNQTMRGLVDCQVVHCAYIISREFYDKAQYTDGTDSHEYVILSRNLRAAKLPQYLDNREVWGSLTMFRHGAELKHSERIRLLEHANLIENGQLVPEAIDLSPWLYEVTDD